MDPSTAKLLNDKLYDKRKAGALELESQVREALSAGDYDKIGTIIHQLCHEFAFAVHHSHARNGGLIGLAAASIALGQDVARYLKEIIRPVLACFNDQDARVRYYACESMYNIAKVAKGEILPYFNEIFDALCKLAADSELSVKNGAELLDRLIKDIVSESAATYVSVLQDPENDVADNDKVSGDTAASTDLPTAFSLPRFIPLLQERVNVLNPYTRTFLVSWITLLDSIPDLELVSYLPSFLGGLFKFLSDPNQDVHTSTQMVLDRFLAEIKKIARIKRGIAESRKSVGEKHSSSSAKSEKSVRSKISKSTLRSHDESVQDTLHDNLDTEQSSLESDSEDDKDSDSDWIPGQDVQVDHPKILDILVAFLSDSRDEEIQLTAIKWIDSFFEICPEDILPFVPRLISQVLPAMSSDIEQVRQAASRLNSHLMDYIMSLDDGMKQEQTPSSTLQLPTPGTPTSKESGNTERRESGVSSKGGKAAPRDHPNDTRLVEKVPDAQTPIPADDSTTPDHARDLDYEAAVNALTLQFLNEHETTRVAALAWLIMLHRKAPRKILAINDGTFPALLKTLSDPAEAVVTRDLLLLSQISKNSDDSYFASFMVNLLQLFCTDRRLLEMRGNLIIRQLCVTLSAERIYRTLADCLEKEEDLEFASIMVQNLNNNLITAPELADLRKRLRNLETRDGQTFFVTLFKSWCHNAVATFSLCLLAQAYEQAYNLLQIFAELEMTVNMLIQIDKLVQLLESPVFTYLRLQLLEPEKFPHLYKCLYGLLMLLPQSSAFAALKNRLNSVSAIGYLHIAQPPRSTTTPSSSNFERPARLKPREDQGGIKWGELLEKFKSVQERARRSNRSNAVNQLAEEAGLRSLQLDSPGRAGTPQPTRPNSAGAAVSRQSSTVGPPPAGTGHQKSKSSLSNLGRFTGGVRGVGKAKR